MGQFEVVSIGFGSSSATSARLRWMHHGTRHSGPARGGRTTICLEHAAIKLANCGANAYKLARGRELECAPELMTPWGHPAAPRLYLLRHGLSHSWVRKRVTWEWWWPLIDAHRSASTQVAIQDVLVPALLFVPLGAMQGSLGTLAMRLQVCLPWRCRSKTC